MTTSTLNDELSRTGHTAPFQWNDDRRQPIWPEPPKAYEPDARYAVYRRSGYQWAWMIGMTMLRDLTRNRTQAKLAVSYGGFNTRLMQLDAAVEHYRARLESLEGRMPAEDLAEAERTWSTVIRLGKGLQAIGRVAFGMNTPLCTGEFPVGRGEVVDRVREALGD